MRGWRGGPGKTIVVAGAALTMVALLVFTMPRVAAMVRPDARWQVRAVEVVAVTADAAPIVAFVDARCEGCPGPLLQLRVCPVGANGVADDAACDVAARRAPAQGGITRLRYARPLERGSYRAEVLFLARDGLGASRSVARVEAVVDVR